jgi:hypothetical protein
VDHCLESILRELAELTIPDLKGQGMIVKLSKLAVERVRGPGILGYDYVLVWQDADGASPKPTAAEVVRSPYLVLTEAVERRPNSPSHFFPSVLTGALDRVCFVPKPCAKVSSSEMVTPMATPHTPLSTGECTRFST